MALGSGRSDQVTAGEFFHYLLRITFGCSRDGLERFGTGPSQNRIQGGRISKEHDWAPTDRGPVAIGKGNLFASAPKYFPSRQQRPQRMKSFRC